MGCWDGGRRRPWSSVREDGLGVVVVRQRGRVGGRRRSSERTGWGWPSSLDGAGMGVVVVRGRPSETTGRGLSSLDDAGAVVVVC